MLVLEKGSLIFVNEENTGAVIAGATIPVEGFPLKTIAL
jgi:hypothetical protein